MILNFKISGKTSQNSDQKTFTLRPWYSPQGTYLQLSNNNPEVKECEIIKLNAQIVSSSEIKGRLHIQIQSGPKIIFSSDYNIDTNSLATSTGNLDGFVEIKKLDKTGKIRKFLFELMLKF